MSLFNIIGSQMNEFQSSTLSIENKFDLIFDVAKDMINDLNIAKKCLNEALAGADKEKLEIINAYKENAEKNLFKELETLYETLKSLVNLTYECKHFQSMELEARNRFVQDPQNHDERQLKKLLNSKPEGQLEHPILAKFRELVEDAKEGKGPEDEDLLMDEPVNQVIKCPITGKPIENGIKNTKCDHMYEREAIMAYIKTKKKCPFAGCTQVVKLN